MCTISLCNGLQSGARVARNGALWHSLDAQGCADGERLAAADEIIGAGVTRIERDKVAAVIAELRAGTAPSTCAEGFREAAASGSPVAKQGSLALQSELLARTRQTVRLHVAAWVGLGRPIPTKRRSRVVAGIQWMRIPNTMPAPMTGVAKKLAAPTQ